MIERSASSFPRPAASVRRRRQGRPADSASTPRSLRAFAGANVNGPNLRRFGGLRLGEAGEVVVRSGEVAPGVSAQVRRRCAADVLGRHEPVTILLLGIGSVSRLRRRLPPGPGFLPPLPPPPPAPAAPG